MINSNIADISSISKVTAWVDILNGATSAVTTCTCSDNLQDFSISRVGDMSKFFGFGICQKMSLNLIDLERNITIQNKDIVTIRIGGDGAYDNPFPSFCITEVNRNERSNNITCTAYDRLIKASELTLADVTIYAPYSIKRLAEAIAEVLETPLKLENVVDSAFDTVYPEGANYSPEGTEKLRAVLDDIAEATQTIYFINNEDNLVFKRLDKDGEAATTVTKDVYYELNSQTTKTISNICSATELGDNITAGDNTGSTQYVRDNPFWELREDAATLIENAVVNISGISISQFDCEWDGDWRLELGDKIELTAEDDSLITSYLLGDTVTYSGIFSEVSHWSFTENDTETESNPSTIGERLNQTSAKVDKVNKQIELVVSEASANSAKLSELEMNTSSISATVSAIETTSNNTSKKVDDLNDAVETLTKEVDLTITEEQVNIAINTRIEAGVEKLVSATKNYTFDDSGLAISSSDSNINTTITEDGMKIYRNSTEVLIADNEGVKAEDLHATTYLIIGKTSRLEEWGQGTKKRTACFWIGG